MNNTDTPHAGFPYPLGAQVEETGVNFAVYSRHAERMWVELYDHVEDAHPSKAYELDPAQHRTGDVWHIWIPGLKAGQLYGFRADGPYRPEEGLRFNRHKLLLDPCARWVVSPPRWDFEPAHGYEVDAEGRDTGRPDSRDDAGQMAKSIVAARRTPRKVAPFPRRPWNETVIYETHVRGLTIHPSSGVDHPGTYRGVIEKLPYLADLGVTAIELLPVFEFNEWGTQVRHPETGEHLRNYWGYDPVAWFAPKANYACDDDPIEAFRELVEAAHGHGIEIILDVVFNHSAESDESGPTLHLRGLDNTVYYLLEPEREHYRNFSGTGNSINASHPAVQDFIIEALRHWVCELRVDGFRFDLASVLARSQEGTLPEDAPLPARIAADPVLRGTKLIAEAWDAAGAYQVGRFSNTRWAEWNGRFRDDIRRFWRGDDGLMGDFATRLCGSSDLYRPTGKSPSSSINFVTCHDGFTLNDLVSYAHKHNEANGENNQDGENANYSDNYGVEGPSDDPDLDALRLRQIKNFFVTLLVSRGVPMMLGGDEFRRTQQGNNNAWCQDNEISWYDWSLLEKNRELHRFVKALIALRRAHPVLSRDAWYSEQDIRFFAPDGEQPEWNEPTARRLGVYILASTGDLCLLFNAGCERVDFALPGEGARRWSVLVDTFEEPSAAVIDAATVPREVKGNYRCEGRSSAILLAADEH